MWRSKVGVGKYGKGRFESLNYRPNSLRNPFVTIFFNKVSSGIGGLG